eukprot:713386-Pyramimonas_sp.AAC.1
MGMVVCCWFVTSDFSSVPSSSALPPLSPLSSPIRRLCELGTSRVISPTEVDIEVMAELAIASSSGPPASVMHEDDAMSDEQLDYVFKSAPPGGLTPTAWNAASSWPAGRSTDPAPPQPRAQIDWEVLDVAH